MLATLIQHLQLNIELPAEAVRDALGNRSMSCGVRARGTPVIANVIGGSTGRM
jgi:hypothetical protein